MLSFDRFGGVPPTLTDNFHLFDIRYGLFFYAPASGNFVTMSEFISFSTYKGGNCMLALGNMAIACSS